MKVCNIFSWWLSPAGRRGAATRLQTELRRKQAVRVSAELQAAPGVQSRRRVKHTIDAPELRSC